MAGDTSRPEPDADDTAKDAPTDSGHSDAETQTERNRDDESPS